MKKETKELIEWIKDKLPKEDTKTEKALIFLNSLEGLEKQLKEGGFIPDVHNKPCKKGDKVRWLGTTNEYNKRRTHGEIYTLNYTMCSFQIDDVLGFVECIQDPREIEKVED